MKTKRLSTVTLLLIAFLLVTGSLVRPVGAAPAAAGVAITGVTELSGVPGSVVPYTLNVKNNKSAAVVLTVTAVSAGGWDTPVIVPSTFNLEVGADKNVIINVPIPAGAVDGQNDIATIYFKNDSGVTQATKQLTTSVSTPQVTGRPLVVVNSYMTTPEKIYTGQECTLTVGLRNKGQTNAKNISVAFAGEGFYPTGTGGVATLSTLAAGETKSVSQTFIISDEYAWVGLLSLNAVVSYTDLEGTEFGETYTLSIVIPLPNVSYSATATPVAPSRPQLMVVGYKTDVDPLQPGSLFNLKLDIKNLGSADAKTVTAVFGGGVSGGGEAGTPSGGLSGGSGDLANFAPIGSSNLVYIGDIAKSSTTTVSQKLVVNVSTAPGAYTLKMSFVYDDTAGNRLVDDQVITLLVYSLPQVEVSFYRDAGVIMAGMENTLPLQVTNLGNKTSILGNMKVTAENAEVMNNVSLVGALEPGGYYTLDATVLPAQEGPMDIKVSINYTDDFNQPRVFETVIPIEVQAGMEQFPTLAPGEEGGMIPGGEFPTEPVSETFWQKIARFFKGLFGLNSGIKEVPTEEIPFEESVPVPAIPKG